jgi:purine-cytosine permease-like protein
VNENIWSFLPKGAQVGGTSLLTCMGIMNGLIGIMALLVSDYARFIKKEEFKLGVFMVGFIPQLVCFFIMGLIGIWFGVRLGEANPGIYFVQVIGVGGALFTILTQFRINICNATLKKRRKSSHFCIEFPKINFHRCLVT